MAVVSFSLENTVLNRLFITTFLPEFRLPRGFPDCNCTTRNITLDNRQLHVPIFTFQCKEESRKIISSGLILKETNVPPYSVFEGHGYLKHAVVGWRVNHALRYNMYLIPYDVQMKNSVFYAYIESLRKDGEQPPSRIIFQERPHGSENRDSDDGSNSDSFIFEPVGVPEPDFSG